MFSRSSFLAVGAAAGAMLLLSGCGAATNAINNSIPDISNLLNLNGQTTDATVGSSRAAISGSGIKEVSFNDRSLSQADKLKFVKFTQNLSPTLTVTVPSGAALPAQFVLSNITLTLTVRDDAPRTVSVSNTVSGPITFVQVSGTNTYQGSTSIGFADFEIKDSFGTFRDIVTTAPSPNFASAKVAFDTDTTTSRLVRFSRSKPLTEKPKSDCRVYRPVAPKANLSSARGLARAFAERYGKRFGKAVGFLQNGLDNSFCYITDEMALNALPQA